MSSTSPPDKSLQLSQTALDNLLGLDLDQEKEDLSTIPKRKKLNNLNESHFLQNKGLPYLRKNSSIVLKSKLKHKDEYKNLTNLLNYYQLWGHRIYPKANFKDFLDMTMKVGAKSKNMKILRESWIKEDMKKDNEELAMYLPSVENGRNQTEERTDGINPNDDNSDSDDDINASFTQRRNRNNLFVTEEDEDDDLYSVPQRNELEKQISIPTQPSSEPITTTNNNNNNDNETIQPPSTNNERNNTDDEFDDDLDDEFDTLVTKPTQDQIQNGSSTPTTNRAPSDPSKTSSARNDIPDDDLDMLLEIEREEKIRANQQQQEPDEEDDYELALLREACF